MSLLDDKNKLLRNSTDNFLESIRKLERSIYSIVLSILDTLDTRSGRLINTDFNLTSMLRLSDQLEQAFQQSQLSQRVRNWVMDFDQILGLQREYWAANGAPFNIDIDNLLSAEQQLTVNKLVRDLVGPGISVNVIDGLQQKIQEGIVTGQRFDNLKGVVRNYIISTDEGNSQLQKYAGVVTRDAIHGFDGTINKVVSEEYNMEAFRYVGSLIEDSRLTCVGLITAPNRIGAKSGSIANPYRDLVLEKGIYMQKDIPEIIRRSRNNPGWNPSTTPETFFVYRGGYNCRHQAIPYKLSERQRNKYLN